MIDDKAWLEFSYPLENDWKGKSESEQAKALELVCIRRLETIWWPRGPECPRCGAHDASEWKDAPRGQGWRCRRCKRRFHVLQAIPAMSATHQQLQLWFRAIYLTGDGRRPSSVELGARLGIEQKGAWKLNRAVGRLRTDSPELLQRIIDGPVAERQKRRRAVRPTVAASEGAAGGTGQPDEFDLADPPMRMPSAFDEDC